MVAALDAAWSVLKADPRYQLYRQYGQPTVPVGFEQTPSMEYEQTRLGTVHPSIAGLLGRMEYMGANVFHPETYIPEERYRMFNPKSHQHIAGLAEDPEVDYYQPPSFRVDAGQLENELMFDLGERGTMIRGIEDPKVRQRLDEYKRPFPIHYDNYPVGDQVMEFSGKPQNPYDIRALRHLGDQINLTTGVMNDFEFGPIQLPQEPIPGVPGGGHSPHFDSQPRTGFMGEVRPHGPNRLSRFAQFGEPINILSTSRGGGGVASSGFHAPHSKYRRDMRERGEDEDITSWHLPEAPARRVYQGYGGDKVALLPGSGKQPSMEELGRQLVQDPRPTSASQFDFAFDEPQYDLRGL